MKCWQPVCKRGKKIHRKEAEERSIYGTVTTEESKELRDEGIDLFDTSWRCKKAEEHSIKAYSSLNKSLIAVFFLVLSSTFLTLRRNRGVCLLFQVRILRPQRYPLGQCRKVYPLFPGQEFLSIFR